MNDAVTGITVKVFIQENGIIRLDDTGKFLGRLDGVTYKELLPKEKVTVNADDLEHLLNCLDNQKFIHEQSKDIQSEWQEIIDKANHKMRQTLNSQVRKAEVSKEKERLLENNTLVIVKNDKNQTIRRILWSVQDDKYGHRYCLEDYDFICQKRDLMVVKGVSL